MTVLDLLRDPQLLGTSFQGESWQAWESFLAAVFGLPMTAEQLDVYRTHTGRTEPPSTPAREAWCVVGRRGGKSRLAALVAVYLATLRDYRTVLAAGEIGTLPVVAADRRQARTVMSYIEGLLSSCPLLDQLVTRRTAEAIELSTGVRIEIHTASWRALRGYTVVGAVLDEVAFWRSDDSANPDTEIVNALRPAMATVPGALLVAISSPYARRGVLWEQYRRHHGKDGDTLVWQAPTRAMNPGVPQRLIDEALEQDESAARAEWLAEFRSDLEAFVSREVLDACTIPGRLGLPPMSTTSYVGFVDPSGGSQDSMTLAITHSEPRGDSAVAVLDFVTERRAPFNPSEVVKEFVEVLKGYNVTTVVGDRYAGEWPREQFQKLGVVYEPSDKNKSEIYGACLPLLNSGRAELLDHPRLHTQLLGLERRTSRGGKDSIDHAPSGHDDLANSVAGAITLAALGGPALEIEVFAQDIRLPDGSRWEPVNWDRAWR